MERKATAQLEAITQTPKLAPHVLPHVPLTVSRQALDTEIQKLERLQELKAHGKLAKSLKKLVTGGRQAAAKRASAHAAATWQETIDSEVASL